MIIRTFDGQLLEIEDDQEHFPSLLEEKAAEHERRILGENEIPAYLPEVARFVV